MSVSPDALKAIAMTGIARQPKSAEIRTRCRVAGFFVSRRATTHAAVDSSMTPRATIRQRLEDTISRIPSLKDGHHRFLFSPLVALALASILRILSSSPRLQAAVVQ